MIFPLSVFIIYKISSNSDSSGNIVDKIVERNITSSDYDITKSEGLTSISFTITPRVKMNTCTIEFKLLDSKENIVYSDTISKSDLMKGSSYTYTFKYGFTSVLSSSKYSWRVSGKCVD